MDEQYLNNQPPGEDGSGIFYDPYAYAQPAPEQMVVQGVTDQTVQPQASMQPSYPAQTIDLPQAAQEQFQITDAQMQQPFYNGAQQMQVQPVQSNAYTTQVQQYPQEALQQAAQVQANLQPQMPAQVVTQPQVQPVQVVTQPQVQHAQAQQPLQQIAQTQVHPQQNAYQDWAMAQGTMSMPVIEQGMQPEQFSVQPVVQAPAATMQPQMQVQNTVPAMVQSADASGAFSPVGVSAVQQPSVAQDPSLSGQIQALNFSGGSVPISMPTPDSSGAFQPPAQVNPSQSGAFAPLNLQPAPNVTNPAASGSFAAVNQAMQAAQNFNLAQAAAMQQTPEAHAEAVQNAIPVLNQEQPVQQQTQPMQQPAQPAQQQAQPVQPAQAVQQQAQPVQPAQAVQQQAQPVQPHASQAQPAQAFPGQQSVNPSVSGSFAPVSSTVSSQTFSTTSTNPALMNQQPMPNMAGFGGQQNQQPPNPMIANQGGFPGGGAPPIQAENESQEKGKSKRPFFLKGSETDPAKSNTSSNNAQPADSNAAKDQVKLSPFAIASFALGVIALCLSPLIFINFAAAVAGLLGAVVGFVALIFILKGKNSGKLFAFIGIGVSILAIVCSLLAQMLFADTLNSLFGTTPTQTNTTLSQASSTVTSSSAAETTEGSTSSSNAGSTKRTSSDAAGGSNTASPTVTTASVVQDLAVGTKIEFSNGLSVSLDSFKTGINNPDISPEPLTCVTVTYINNGEEAVNFNSYSWKAEDASGAQRNEAFLMEAENVLGSGDLDAGGFVTGNIYFTEPVVKIIYSPSSSSAKKDVTWLLA